MSEYQSRFGEQVLRFRWLIILLTLVAVALAASGGKNLEFTNNYRIFFSPENPQRVAFETLENTYSKNDNVLMVLAPHDGKVFTPEFLSLVEWVTERGWQVPYSSRVDSITNFQHTEAEADDLVVRDLIKNAPSLTAEQLRKAREIAVAEPLLINRLINRDASITAVNITVQLPRINEVQEGPEVVEDVRAIADEIKQRAPNVDVYMTGMIMLNHAFGESSRKDMASLVPLSFGVMFLVLLIMMRGVSATFGTLLVVFFSILAAMGAGGHIGFPLTPPSATAPTVILTVAIANCVHIAVTYLQGLRAGLDKHAAVIESLRVNLQPVFLASLTTTIGFLTMNFSEVPPFQHLGNFVAMGVVSSFVLSVTFLPAVLSLLPSRVRVVEQGSRDRFMSRLGAFVVSRRRPLMWGMIAVVLVLVSGLPRNELNDVFVEYFDHDIQFRVDSDFTVDHLTGLYNIEYSLESAGAGGISEPEFLAEVAAFGKWFEEQPETLHVNTITDVFKRLNKNMHGDADEWYRLPHERDLSAQYLLLYEMSLPYGLDLNNQINVDKSATRMTVTLKTVSSNELVALDKRAQAWLAANTRHIQQKGGTGTSVMFANIGSRNIKAMLIGTSVALVLISLILVVAMRSVKMGLLSLVPNLVPAAMGFGVWGLAVGQVGLALSVVSTMTLGIVVDDTVHFLSKYLRARRENGLSAPAAVRYAFETVGRALLTTTLVLIAGFLILALSSFELNAGMGLLTAIVLALALAADFFLLPPLLMKLEERANEGSTATGTASA